MRLLHLLLSAALCSAFTPADNITEYDKQFFIDTYASLAIAEMHGSGIPASITLAQAILESGWGRGSVAEGGNNYFCIKCNNGWEGETYEAKDDEPGLSCFRKYQNVFESFSDHSHFLTESPRYRPLFELEKSDFRGWANGLKECGYATDRAYGSRLIDIIEEHGLWLFDYAIPMTHFKQIDAPEMAEYTSAEIPEEPNSYNGTADLAIQVGVQALAMPVYSIDKERQEEMEASTGTLEEWNDSPVHPDTGKYSKIRPIVPHPMVNVTRAE